MNGFYPLVNYHRPWQIGVGRLVSIKHWWFSGSMFIYHRVPHNGKIWKVSWDNMQIVAVNLRVHRTNGNMCGIKTNSFMILWP